MPLSTIQDYERLGEHLREIDPILEDFCRERSLQLKLEGGGNAPVHFFKP